MTERDFGCQSVRFFTQSGAVKKPFQYNYVTYLGKQTLPTHLFDQRLEFIHIPKTEINTGKTDIGHFVELF